MDQLRRLCREHSWLCEALQFIGHQLLEGTVEVPAIAAHLHVGPVQLNRRLNKALGVPPARLVRQLRVQEAAYRLQLNRAGVTHIAYELGFYDAAHFCRAFEEVLGCSPGVFRQAVRADADLVSVPEILHALK